MAIDPNHAPALIGRENQKLRSGTADLAVVFTDLELAERLDRSATGLQEAMGEAYANRAMANAEQSKINEAKQDLRKAEQLRAS